MKIPPLYVAVTFVGLCVALSACNQYRNSKNKTLEQGRVEAALEKSGSCSRIERFVEIPTTDPYAHHIYQVENFDGQEFSAEILEGEVRLTRLKKGCYGN